MRKANEACEPCLQVAGLAEVGGPPEDLAPQLLLGHLGRLAHQLVVIAQYHTGAPLRGRAVPAPLALCVEKSEPHHAAAKGRHQETKSQEGICDRVL